MFKVDADVTKFVSLYINKNLVDPKYYTINSGSTIITFSDEYTKTLTNGKYELDIVYNDGRAQGSFVVNNADEDNPNTGSFITSTIIILGLAGITLLVTNKKKLFRI